MEYSPLIAPLEQFQRLKSVWRHDTAYLSDLTQISSHWAYQQIIAMGWTVVPILLRELDANPDYWFSALRKITGANPVPPESRGRVHEMATAWLEWAQSNGISW
ncbi:MAG: hypothetical protein ACYC35_07080 [Pirellulales bacterium]